MQSLVRGSAGEGEAAGPGQGGGTAWTATPWSWPTWSARSRTTRCMLGLYDEATVMELAKTAGGA